MWKRIKMLIPDTKHGRRRYQQSGRHITKSMKPALRMLKIRPRQIKKPLQKNTMHGKKQGIIVKTQMWQWDRTLRRLMIWMLATDRFSANFCPPEVPYPSAMKKRALPARLSMWRQGQKIRMRWMSTSCGMRSRTLNKKQAWRKTESMSKKIRQPVKIWPPWTRK